MALDHAGNAYYAGFTASPEFPTTPGALKTSLQPGTTLIGFVTKLDPAGRLKWSTYLGGNGLDSASGIGVDSSRHVYVSGSTIGGFPVTAGAVQETKGGARDWFVAKLDRSGSSLDWATYLGGSDFDGFSPTLRVDQWGHADVVGPTASTDFPTTPNAFQPANAGGLDLGIVQLDRNGRLLFSSYLGGSGDDEGFGYRSRPAGQPLRRRGDQLDRLPGHSRRDPTDLRRRRHRRPARQGDAHTIVKDGRALTRGAIDIPAAGPRGAAQAAPQLRTGASHDGKRRPRRH